MIRDDTYENKVTKSQWLTIFDEWLTNDLQKREKKRIAIKNQSILFLKYIYVRILLAEHQTSEVEFQMEHIVPVDRLKSIAGEEGIPISAFPNLCLLTKRVNEEKQSKTFYEFIKHNIDQGKITQDQAKKDIENIEIYSFTNEADLKFVEDKSTFNAKKYEVFLKDRFELITNKFFELYEIN